MLPEARIEFLLVIYLLSVFKVVKLKIKLKIKIKN